MRPPHADESPASSPLAASPGAIASGAIPSVAVPSIATPPVTAPISAAPISAAWYSQVTLALLTAILLDLCFPLAAPMPAWQGAFAWIALVPLLFAILRPRALAQRHALRNIALTGYLCGIVWNILNCYWIYRTMHFYAGVPPAGAAGILLLYGLYLGLYFGLFAWLLALFRKRLGLIAALALAPILWPAVEVLACRLTGNPWDQLGYAQVDNFWLTRLAPWTGTYGIATLIVIGNVLFTAALLQPRWSNLRMRWPLQASTWLAQNKKNPAGAPFKPGVGLSGKEAHEDEGAPFKPSSGLSGKESHEGAGAPHLPAVGRCGTEYTQPTAQPTGISHRWLVAALLLCGSLQAGSWLPPPPEFTTSTALLLQTNLGTLNTPQTPAYTWQGDISRFTAASLHDCRPWLPGIPQLAHSEIQPDCSAAYLPHPGLIVWPEAQSPFADEDPAFRSAMSHLAQTAHAGIITGDIATQYFLRNGKPASATYNSASVFAPSGSYIGRYDKIHLVPFGEYLPYKRLFSWAGALVDQVGQFTHGRHHSVFHIHNHTYGIFICYESIFSNEVRIFAKNGAQVFVNISDDGWYGNTSAPWQHLNMARMRAIENHRWILLDTNNGITSAIDPEGRVTQSIPRNQFTALVARYGFESDHTFYTEHGDIYAYGCAFACAVLALLALASRQRIPE